MSTVFLPKRTWMRERLRAEPELSIHSADFICWLHREFYQRLPEDLQFTESITGKRERLQPGAKVLIMGAGLIGCEFANDLAGAGFQVHVVDPATRPLAALLPEAASAPLQQALGDLGVVWHLNNRVTSVSHGLVQAAYLVRHAGGNGHTGSIIA
jgi:NADPH-dependent 2,4-dienoyl-CoA reductase/sulfur reductase-like enzyme